MCVMVPQKYNFMNFCDCCNHTSLRLSRYAYYTVMYTACHNLMSNCLCKVHMYRLYNEDGGLSNIHDRGLSPRTCIFDDPESELYNRLVPECGGVSVSYWFIQSCPM